MLHFKLNLNKVNINNNIRN